MHHESHVEANQLAEQIAGEFYGNGFDTRIGNLASDGAWSHMPEVKACRRIRSALAPANTVRLFLTFIAAMDRRRDATILWEAAIALFGSHPNVFDPAYASRMLLATLRERLVESGVSPLSEGTKDARAWQTIARTLDTEHGSAVSWAICNGTGKVSEILEDLRTPDYEGRSRFPMLRGPKVGPMWVRMLAAPGGADLDELEAIPVAVDVHVRRVSENLGVTDTRSQSLDDARPVIQRAWRAAVAGSRVGGPSGITGTSAALDPALWFLGKHGCSHCERVGQRVPVSRACHGCQLA